MDIRVNSAWKKGIPMTYISGAWRKPKDAWIFTNGAWKRYHVYEYTYIISSDVAAFNLFYAIGIPDAEVINIIINPGVTISSTSTSVPAFNVGNSYHGKTINIINDGTISGAGGKGGAGGSNSGGAGGPGGSGGTALYARTSKIIKLTNNGRIGGGSGGGGGGGGALVGGSLSHSGYRTHSSWGGAGGDGGLAFMNGSNGSPSGGDKNDTRTFKNWGGAGGKGGSDSSPGAAGGAGVARVAGVGRPTARGGAGGAAGLVGNAIDGKSKIFIEKKGVIKGGIVN